MLSAGMFSALAATMAPRRRGLPSGSPPPGFGSDGNFLNETGEDLATFGVKRALLMLDCGPF